MSGGRPYTGKKETALAALSLFAGAGTLVCCALPALLVAMGMGAVMAGLAANVPALVWISAHKKGVFILAALLLACAGGTLRRGRSLPCPVDPAQAKACKRMRRISLWTYYAALVLYAAGFFFAYLAAMFI